MRTEKQLNSKIEKTYAKLERLMTEHEMAKVINWWNRLAGFATVEGDKVEFQMTVRLTKGIRLETITRTYAAW